jgi:hypothetical protein
MNLNNKLKNRFYLPQIIESLLFRVDSIEKAPAPSGGITTLSGDFVDNTDPLNPVLNKGYKEYTATVMHDGLEETTIVHENTLGYAVTWALTSTGVLTSNIDLTVPGTVVPDLQRDSLYIQATSGDVTVMRLIDYLGDFLVISRYLDRSTGSVVPTNGIKLHVTVLVYNQ